MAEKIVDDFLQKFDDYDLQKRIDSNWKVILIYMFKNTATVSIPKESPCLDFEKEYIQLVNKLFFIMSDTKLFNESGEYIKRTLLNSSPSKEEASNIAYKSIVIISKQVFKKLNLYGYVTVSDNIIHQTTVQYNEYKITEKGIDVALRLQEHEDNERRHNTTVSYSKKAFWISSIALIIASISMLFNYKRLDLYEKQVNKIESAQTDMIKKLNLEKSIKKKHEYKNSYP